MNSGEHWVNFVFVPFEMGCGCICLAEYCVQSFSYVMFLLPLNAAAGVVCGRKHTINTYKQYKHFQNVFVAASLFISAAGAFF